MESQEDLVPCLEHVSFFSLSLFLVATNAKRNISLKKNINQQE
jgi:hypothetical protein